MGTAHGTVEDNSKTACCYHIKIHQGLTGKRWYYIINSNTKIYNLCNLIIKMI